MNNKYQKLFNLRYSKKYKIFYKNLIDIYNLLLKLIYARIGKVSRVVSN